MLPGVREESEGAGDDNARQVTLGKPVHRCVPVQATVGSTPLPFENRPAHTCYEAKPNGVPNPDDNDHRQQPPNHQADREGMFMVGDVDDLPG